MKLNADKCHLLVLGQSSDDPVTVRIGTSEVVNVEQAAQQNDNKIQERALRITHKDAESTYSELLEKDCAVTIHTKNLQLLMTEMYKTKNGLNPISHGVFFRYFGMGGRFWPPLIFSETTKDITMKLSSIVLWTISIPNITMVIN